MTAEKFENIKKAKHTLVEATLDRIWSDIEEAEYLLERKRQMWGAMAVNTDCLSLEDIVYAMSLLDKTNLPGDEIVKIILDTKGIQ